MDFKSIFEGRRRDILQGPPSSERYEEITRVTQAEEDLYKRYLPFELGPPLSPPPRGYRTQVFQNKPAPELIARGFCLVPKGSDAEPYAETPVNMTGVSTGVSPRATLTPNEVDRYVD